MLAGNMNLKCTMLPWVAETNKALTNLLLKRGFIPLYGKPYFELDIKWSSFDHYLSSLSSKRRYATKKEMKQFHDCGLSLHECDAHDALARLDHFAMLVHQHLQQFHHKESYSAVLNTLRTIYESMCDLTRTFYVTRNEDIVGYMMSLCKDNVYYPKFIGFEKETKKTSSLYLNLVYYKLIESAISSKKIRKIYYGYASEEVKLTRGCHSYNGYCYYKFTNPKIHHHIGALIGRYNKIRKGYFVNRFSDFINDNTNNFVANRF